MLIFGSGRLIIPKNIQYILHTMDCIVHWLTWEKRSLTPFGVWKSPPTFSSSFGDFVKTVFPSISNMQKRNIFITKEIGACQFCMWRGVCEVHVFSCPVIRSIWDICYSWLGISSALLSDPQAPLILMLCENSYGVLLCRIFGLIGTIIFKEESFASQKILDYMFWSWSSMKNCYVGFVLSFM